MLPLEYLSEPQPPDSNTSAGAGDTVLAALGSAIPRQAALETEQAHDGIALVSPSSRPTTAGDASLEQVSRSKAASSAEPPKGRDADASSGLGSGNGWVPERLQQPARPAAPLLRWAAVPSAAALAQAASPVAEPSAAAACAAADQQEATTAFGSMIADVAGAHTRWNEKAELPDSRICEPQPAMVERAALRRLASCTWTMPR